MQCVVRSVLKHAKEAGFISRLPELPPLPKTGATITHALTREEVGRILAATPAPHHLALELAAYAGLRAGEVRGLRFKDVDLERGVLIVRRSRCRGTEAPPKSGHERIVPLHTKLIDAIGAITPRPASAYVTGPAPGEPWGEHALRHAFLGACRRLELHGFRPHDLRHAFVTELFRGGTPAPVVQRLAGHEQRGEGGATDSCAVSPIRRDSLGRGNSGATERFRCLDRDPTASGGTRFFLDYDQLRRTRPSGGMADAADSKSSREPIENLNEAGDFRNHLGWLDRSATTRSALFDPPRHPLRGNGGATERGGLPFRRGGGRSDVRGRWRERRDPAIRESVGTPRGWRGVVRSRGPGQPGRLRKQRARVRWRACNP